jgi:hypothetical protein
MKTIHSCKAALALVMTLSSAACLFASSSQAQVVTATYDFHISASGTASSRSLALGAAISDARARCGFGASLVGYGKVEYTPDLGATWALIEGYCKKTAGGDQGKSDPDSDQKLTDLGTANTPPPEQAPSPAPDSQNPAQ